MASPGNWMHLQYQSRLQARKALSKDGKVFGDAIMVGVKPCIDKVSTHFTHLLFSVALSALWLTFHIRWHWAQYELSSSEFVVLAVSECDGQQRSRLLSTLHLLFLLCPPIDSSLSHQTAQRRLQELRQWLPGDLWPQSFLGPLQNLSWFHE